MRLFHNSCYKIRLLLSYIIRHNIVKQKENKMRTYAQIKELKGFENDRVEMVLRYIAENYDKKHSYNSIWTDVL